VVERLRNQRGFTLIELSIVLVIIGIILAAVLKGQDLIDNAKAKKVANMINQWQTPMNQYYDTFGYLPGDSGAAAGSPTGVIANIAAMTASLAAVSMNYPSPVVGDISVAITNGAPCGLGLTKNFMLITLPATATLTFIETIDANVDGTALGNSGRLMNCGINGLATAGSWVAGSNTLTYIF
jgi:prepilin-type N-terminal cleavage/methylation domain-containing protein